MAITARVEETKSPKYRGPEVDAPYALYVECGERAFYVDFDSKEDFPSALTKAGVALYNAANPDHKPVIVDTSKN